MKTIFTLTFIEASDSSVNIMDSVNGPFIFESESDAKDRLLAYVIDRIKCREYLDIFTLGEMLVPSVEDTKNEDTYAEATFLALKKNDVLRDQVITEYFESKRKEGQSAGYSISQTASASFIDQLQTANKININGSIVSGLKPSIQSHLSINGDEIAIGNYIIPYRDALSACFIASGKYWLVGDNQIKIINSSDTPVTLLPIREAI